MTKKPIDTNKYSENDTLSEDELLMKLDYAFGAMSAYEGFDEAHQQIKILTEKPQVTEEWIAEMVNKVFARLLAMHGAFGRPWQMRSILKDFVRSLVEEIKNG